MTNKKSQNLETKTIYTALHSPRVAVFIDIENKQWKKIAVHIVEVLCTLWGGDNYILIPTDGKKIDPIFEEILKAYDPDFIAIYQRTGYDLKEIYEKKFNNIRDAHIAKFSKENPDFMGASLERYKKDYEKELLRSNLGSKLELSDNVKNFIKRELSVFHFQDDIQEHRLDYSGQTPHLLPKLKDIFLANVKLNDLKLAEMDFKGFNEFIRILGYANTGKGNKFSEQLVQEAEDLKKRAKEIWKHDLNRSLDMDGKAATIGRILREFKIERFAKADFSSMLRSLWRRSIDIDGLSFKLAFRAAVKKNSKATDNFYNYFSRLPFPISNIGLTRFMQSGDSLKDEMGDPVVIVGNSLSDFCLYYSLMRLRSKVYWIPYSVLTGDAKNPRVDSYTFYLINELREDSMHSDSKEVKWITTSLGSKKSAKVPDLMGKSDLITMNSYGFIKDKIKYTDNPSEIITYILRLYEVGNANNFSAYQFVDKEGVGFIDTPTPKTFIATDPTKHKWISEVSIKDYRYPCADFLSSKVFLGEGTGYPYSNTIATRVSYTGIQYQSPTAGFIRTGDSVNDSLVKPKLRFIDASEIFSDLFAKAGYHIRPSDKGSYLLQTLNNFENLEELANLIKKDNARKLFDLFATPNNQQGVYDKGAYIDKRRYLDFNSIINLIPNKDEATELLEYLSEKGLLDRGYALKCTFCNNNSWYFTKDVGVDFICKRCLNHSVIKKENLRLQEPSSRFEPIIYYKLNEIFYQFWLHNGYLTVLTLQKLKSTSSGSLIFLSETEFRKDPTQEKPDFELDILVILDGKLYLGEAKKDANTKDKNNKLYPEHINRLISLASTIPLNGLVFTSWSNRWPANVLGRLGQIDKSYKFIVTRFSETDLLT